MELQRKEELKEARWGKRKVTEMEESGDETERELEALNKKGSNKILSLLIVN